MLFSIAAGVVFFFAVIGIFLSLKEIILDFKRESFKEYTLIKADGEESAEGMLRYAMLKYRGDNIYVDVCGGKETDALIKKLSEEYQLIHVIEK